MSNYQTGGTSQAVTMLADHILQIFLSAGEVKTEMVYLEESKINANKKCKYL